MKISILEENTTHQIKHNFKVLSKDNKNNKRDNNSSILSQKLSNKILDFFAEEELEQIAQESGFISKESKLSGYQFLDALLFSKTNFEQLSLNDLSGQLQDKHNLTISKQGIDKRFSKKSVAFFKMLIQKFIAKKINTENDLVPVTSFARVRIKDSTCFQLPEEMHEKYPGSGGSASKAAVRIQFEYDYISGEVITLTIHPFTYQDTKEAKDTTSDILEKDLIIRDLGYVNIPVLQEIENKKAYYLNRIHTNVLIFEKNKDGNFVKLNYKAIEKTMQKKGICRLEKEVYIGAEYKHKTRIMLELVPEDIKNSRIRTIRKNAKRKKRKVNEENIAKAAFTILITNATKESLPMENMYPIYRLRWQIELMFKVWKSIGQLDKVKRMKVERFETCLYARLLLIIINWNILWQIQKHIYKEMGILISFIKAFKTFKDRMDEFRNITMKKVGSLSCYINKIYEMSPRNHILEKRNNKFSSYEILMLLQNT